MDGKLQIAFGLLGGLAVFIYGMNLMSECLQKAAGERMKSILALLTKNPLMGALAGALVTAVLQSSSATTVMAIGFVSAGLMTLPQAVSIILGANIGTTMTAQLIAFKLSDYIYLIIFAGFFISFICRSEKARNIGQTIFAFGLLFLGIETMGSVMKPLASSPVFTDLIGRVSDIPVLGVLTGMLMTLVVQSSSATIAVLQNFASQAGPDGVHSVIGLAGAIPILLGDNIGTTITALLASIGQTRDAKRTAAAHCVFNVSGCLLFIWFIEPFAALIRLISPKGPEVEVISRQIANAHTMFNVVMTLLWIPMIAFMVQIVTRLIPDGRKEILDPAQPMFLDENIVNQPAAALQLAVKEVMRCGEIVDQMILDAGKAAEGVFEGMGEKIAEQRNVVAGLYQRITEYLAEMFATGVLTETQATQTARLMHVMSDIERLSSMAAEVAASLYEHASGKRGYSAEAQKDIKKSLRLVHGMYGEAMRAVAAGDPENARRLKKKSERVRELDIRMRKAHMQRVSKGKCRAGLTASFNEVLYCINRMGGSCANILDEASAGFCYRGFLDERRMSLPAGAVVREA